MDANSLILIKLLSAHIIADFPLQPDSWITDRREKHGKSKFLWMHSLFHGGLAWLFVFQWQAWWIGITIVITHFFIDVWKSKRPEKLRYFFVDQGSHVIIILVLWGIFTGIGPKIPGFIAQMTLNGNIWLVILGYTLVIWPIGIIIQQLIQYNFDFPEEDQGLEAAGKWIGYFERILVVTFVLVSAYSALGLLIAAKSILRISTDKSSGRKETEYILLGTLMSWSMAIIIGILLRYLLFYFPK